MVMTVRGRFYHQIGRRRWESSRPEAPNPCSFNVRWQLLHQQPGHVVYLRGDHVASPVDTASEQLLQLLASHHARG